MWEHDWAASGPGLRRRANPYREAPFRAVAPLFWEEHCTECAAPGCFSSCPLHVPRQDGSCARFVRGIERDHAYPGLHGYGADIRLRRWARLQTRVPRGFVVPRLVTLAIVVDRWVAPVSRWVSRRFRSRRSDELVGVAYARRRRSRLRRLGGLTDLWPQAELLVDVWNLEDRPCSLLFEYVLEGIVLGRHSWQLHPGRNTFRLSMRSFPSLRPGHRRAVFRVMLGEDREAHLVFGALDVGIPVRSRTPSPTLPGRRPATYVKCVAWDLDNTVWHGVLAEDGIENLALRDDALRLIRALDERGILQTVVSKNDEGPALEALERFGIEQFMLRPAISWLPKSEGLRRVARDLEIGTDTFLFLDDSAFERAEVERAFPEMRTNAPIDLQTLAGRTELNPPRSEEGLARRRRYLQEDGRRRALDDFAGDYAEFVRSCDIRAEVFRPTTDAEVERCVELIQRSNQLNLSGNRHDEAAFRRMPATAGFEWLALSAADVFGDYGLIGVMGLRHEPPVLEVTDLCVSCRAARRMIEQAWFAWLAERSAAAYAEVRAVLVPTEQNRVLQETLAAIGFRRAPAPTGGEMLTLSLPVSIDGADVVTVTSRDPAAVP